MGRLAFGLLLCFCPLALLAEAHRPMATFLPKAALPKAFILEQNRFLVHDEQVTTGPAVKGGMRQYWLDVESILKWPRSAPPADVIGGYSFATGTAIRYRRDVNPGVPQELFGSQYPGGKIFNKAAFTAPPSGQEGNFGRNVLRGFGAFQGNFAIQRQCRLTERVGLRFRDEFFNVFNHLKVGPPTNDPFGYSTADVGNGGLSPLYQIGGPRSIQLALKLQF